MGAHCCDACRGLRCCSANSSPDGWRCLRAPAQNYMKALAEEDQNAQEHFASEVVGDDGGGGDSELFGSGTFDDAMLKLRTTGSPMNWILTALP